MIFDIIGPPQNSLLNRKDNYKQIIGKITKITINSTQFIFRNKEKKNIFENHTESALLRINLKLKKGIVI